MPGLARLTPPSFLDRSSLFARRQKKGELTYELQGGTALPPLKAKDKVIVQGTNKKWIDTAEVTATRPSGLSYALEKNDGSAIIRGRKLLKRA